MKHKSTTIAVVVAVALLAGCASSVRTKQIPVRVAAPQVTVIDIPVAMAPRTFVLPSATPEGLPFTADGGTHRIFESVKTALFNGKYDGDLKLDNSNGTLALVATWPKKPGAEYGPVSARFALSTAVRTDAFVYTLECPSQLSIVVEKAGVIGLSDTQPIAFRLNEACRSAHMPFSDETVFRGEVNSRYSEAALFENYKRCLAKRSEGMVLVKQDDSQKEIVFSDPRRNLVTLRVVPYKSGSQVEYRFNYRYDGDETSGKYRFSQADIDATKKAISDFAND